MAAPDWAYHAAPGDARRGGLLILPGLDGATAGLCALADDFAREGYEIGLPDLDLGSADEDPMARADYGLACLPAVQAAIDTLNGPVFALGFGFGGTLAWLASARCGGLAAAAAFYGGHVVRWLDEGPRCPVNLHFARQDAMVAEADVQRIEEAHPDLPVFRYDAGHGFAEPGRAHAEDAAKLALLRTRQLFMRSGGKGEMGG